ncbi:MAG: sugar phosphate isomerase/epimerase [Ruminococcaceae bacterium]|nr:sugar phosphate isomerase/epimerase [Oscillospiraceae bacterium]
MKFSLGLCSVSFRKSSAEEIIKAASGAGLDFIEWGSDVHAPCGDGEKIKEIITLQEGYGIRSSSYGTYFRLGVNNIAELPRYIESALLLGTDTLRLWCGDKSGEEMTSSEKEALFLECHRAREVAEEYKVKLCLERHKKTLTEDLDSTLELMNKLCSRRFLTYWQPFQWQCFEKNLQSAKRLSPYTENIHVFNWNGEDKLPLRDAEGEWRDYLQCFSPCKLLLEFMPKGGISELVDEAAALRVICGGVK